MRCVAIRPSGANDLCFTKRSESPTITIALNDQGGCLLHFSSIGGYRELSRANASRVPWEHDSSLIERILPPMDNTEIGDFVATAVNWDEEPYCVELADAALPPFGATCPTLW